MTKNVLRVTFVVLSMCLAAPRASATEDQPTHNDLAEMNATLKEIARSLKQQAATQKADLLLKRVTLAMTQLTKAQERLKAIEQERHALESQRGDFETLLASAQKETTPQRDTDSTRAQITDIKNHLQIIQEQLSALRQEEVAAENDIEALRREARDWQALLDKTITSGS